MTRRVIVRPTAAAYTLRGVSVQPTVADVDGRPAKAPLPSGRLLLRMPPDLHAELAQAAEREGSSLNGYITPVFASPWTAQPADDGSPGDVGPGLERRR